MVIYGYIYDTLCFRSELVQSIATSDESIKWN